RPLLRQVVMQCWLRTHRARDGEGTETQLIHPIQDPRPAPAVAIEPHAHVAVVGESDRVLGLVVGRQDRAVAALELHELPRRVADPPELELGADEQPAAMPSVIKSTRSRFMGGLLLSSVARRRGSAQEACGGTLATVSGMRVEPEPNRYGGRKGAPCLSPDGKTR